MSTIYDLTKKLAGNPVALAAWATTNKNSTTVVCKKCFNVLHKYLHTLNTANKQEPVATCDFCFNWGKRKQSYRYRIEPITNKKDK